ncbi:hypothetical protein GCM10022219_15210 [Microbacterium oryzae]|uniref:Uncharacterized protein n=1 Tax=Microbacterium oryzae TaxID=743009 RepID=A0A6I6DZF1_9MICO|nr:hypothetical protein [Microbacterium oryzae]QGU28163.1 hypothetical protein D7D94_11105 [Microbacterium oryzae]
MTEPTAEAGDFERLRDRLLGATRRLDGRGDEFIEQDGRNAVLGVIRFRLLQLIDQREAVGAALEMLERHASRLPAGLRARAYTSPIASNAFVRYDMLTALEQETDLQRMRLRLATAGEVENLDEVSLEVPYLDEALALAAVVAAALR